MSGTKECAKKSAETTKKKYGNDWYKIQGAKGGKKSRNGGFASSKVGEDGLTGKERASVAGAKGGRLSKRGPAK